MVDKNGTQFQNAHIERCDKETENVIAKETASFLEQPVQYLKKHMNEFIYLESDVWETVRTDSVSLEVDDVFGTYEVLLGLKLQKKFQPEIKAFFEQELQGEGAKYSLLFSHEDGLWDLNFALDLIDGFSDELSIGQAYELVYTTLSKLVETVNQ